MSVPEAGLQYAAHIRWDGRQYHIAFPDWPGCKPVAVETHSEVHAKASATLDAYLRARLKSGDIFLSKSLHEHQTGVECRPMHVDTRVAFAVCARTIRDERGLSVATYAKELGLSDRELAEVEDPDATPTAAAVEKVTQALNLSAL